VDSSSGSIRIGVVGLGNIAQQHIKNVLEGHVRHAKLTAICSRSESDYRRSLDVAHFTDYRELIASGLCDAVVVATPTYSHLDVGAAVLDAGLHLMMEKPMGLSIAEGEELVARANRSGAVAALMLNQRADPLFLRMREIVASGDLGDLIRINWTMTNWFRPEVYFQVSDWRATWRGEGGGVLVNQCIHNLDILQWICGMPSSLRAFCRFGRFHDVEVEDDVTAYLEYDNGATGIFVGSTGEAPGNNRFEIIGDSGSLVFDGKTLTVSRNEVSTAQFNRETREMFGMPGSSSEPLSIDRAVNQHAIVLSNFVAAILRDESLIAPLDDGLSSLAIANGMLMSTWTDSKVDFPIDAVEYSRLLQQKIESSVLRTKAQVEVNIDMSSSYR
jgi:predicted dehydrogenase